MRRRAFIWLSLCFGYLHAAVINVPGDQPTIQTGINAAIDGDTVLVQPGTYVENINFNGKSIVVGSLYQVTGNTSYISSTIIDGNQNGSVVTFTNGENHASIIEGFTITNGYVPGAVWSGGGGINCSYSSPTISFCIIKNNEVEFYNWTTQGAGVKCFNSSPIITNSIISNNQGPSGIGIFEGNPTIQSSVIANNSGAGIHHIVESYVQKPVVLNSIISGNDGQSISLTDNMEPFQADITVMYSCIPDWNNVSTNISLDPMFIDSNNGNYHISNFSPCIGAGIDSVQINGTWYHVPTSDRRQSPPQSSRLQS